MKIALSIIYNHNFEQNIEKLEKIYLKRFSNIIHLMPFYQGNKQNVISIYEPSYLFQKYVSSLIQQIPNIINQYDSFIFIHDDVLLNPNLNENNIHSYLEIDSDDSFIHTLSQFDIDKLKTWNWTLSILYHIDKQQNNCQEIKFLPDKEAAFRIFEKYGFKKENFIDYNLYSQFLNNSIVDKNNQYRIDYTNFNVSYNKSSNYCYPLVRSFSDFFIVSSRIIEKFAFYCGLFGALNVFAEAAIPTSMVFASEKKIKISSNTKRKTINFTTIVGNKYSEMIKNFPEDFIYKHSLKLSNVSVDI